MRLQECGFLSSPNQSLKYSCNIIREWKFQELPFSEGRLVIVPAQLFGSEVFLACFLNANNYSLRKNGRIPSYQL